MQNWNSKISFYIWPFRICTPTPIYERKKFIFIFLNFRIFSARYQFILFSVSACRSSLVVAAVDVFFSGADFELLFCGSTIATIPTTVTDSNV